MSVVATHGLVTDKNILRVALVHHCIEREAPNIVALSPSVVSRLHPLTVLREWRIVHGGCFFTNRGAMWTVGRLINCCASLLKSLGRSLDVDQRVSLLYL